MFQAFLGVHWSSKGRSATQTQLRFKVFGKALKILRKKENSCYSDMLGHLFTTERGLPSGRDIIWKFEGISHSI